MKPSKKMLAVAYVVCLGCNETTVHTTGEPVAKNREPQTLGEYVQYSANAYGLDPALVHAVIETESGGDPLAVRYEPRIFEKLREPNKSKRLQLASSHGLMQVMGVEAERRGVAWPELYNVETNLEVGASMLADCKQRSAAKSKLDRLREALSCYNSGYHRSTQGARYADKVLLRYLARKLQ